MLKTVVPAVCALGLAACATPAHPENHTPDMPEAAKPVPAEASAIALIIGGSGAQIGLARLKQGPHGVLMEVTIDEGGLAPGWHGLHLHEKGDCSDVGTFTLSGGHHGKAEGKHGLMNPVGPEMGDLPNIWAGADGAAGYEAFTGLFELAPALEGDGIALVIHQNRDDHLTQPIGGAGPRVACAVIEADGS
ncbi:superoxide dismutase family protein [Hyphomonas sp.]|uniref:superoxide dismutase family protein n=1 Tax=Hyphomonas sp. TaxID=87 RepID=UPI001BCF1863|nr:superoxide dismutase family protein [Hyphomonas sp.]